MDRNKKKTKRRKPNKNARLKQHTQEKTTNWGNNLGNDLRYQVNIHFRSEAPGKVFATFFSRLPSRWENCWTGRAFLLLKTISAVWLPEMRGVKNLLPLWTPCPRGLLPYGPAHCRRSASAPSSPPPPSRAPPRAASNRSPSQARPPQGPSRLPGPASPRSTHSSLVRRNNTRWRHLPFLTPPVEYRASYAELSECEHGPLSDMASTKRTAWHQQCREKNWTSSTPRLAAPQITQPPDMRAREIQTSEVSVKAVLGCFR